ncbi:MAG TPA: hypothetical protein PKH79_09215 [Prolixibacteraceae bacterium]|nr:hypothetical protein [Prolixibacteraceae bacterium]
MKRNILFLSAALALSILLSSWGYTGHHETTKRAGLSLAQKVEGIDQWMPFVAEHASDPDYRKAWDKSEFPKHFIDIDGYPEFVSSGHINTRYDSLVALHGEPFVIEEGILPWATHTAYDSLCQCLKRKDFYHAAIWMVNLSHYVGDGHMPLHVTKNYDGQETGNKGIHSRYESKMIIAYASSITTSSTHPVKIINDITPYLFNYLYQSNKLCDSIFHADNQAKKANSDFESPEYLAVLWKNTSSLTADQFNKGADALGCLIYTAWINAGSPDLSGFKPTDELYSCKINTATVNADQTIMTIDYQIKESGTYKIAIRNADGTPVLKPDTRECNPGIYSSSVDISTLPKGNYLATIDCANFTSTRKFSKD